MDERRSAPVALPKAGQDWSAQYLIFLTSLAKTSSQPLQLLHLQRCADALPARRCNTLLVCVLSCLSEHLGEPCAHSGI